MFEGLAPWAEGMEIIECAVGGVVIDLYNECTLLDSTITCAPAVDLCLRFVRDADGLRVHLVFVDVTELNFVEESSPRLVGQSGWSGPDVETFYGVEFRNRGDGSAEFVVSTIIGTYKFVCGKVQLRIGDSGVE